MWDKKFLKSYLKTKYAEKPMKNEK